ncbi:MAG: hypothetical protein E7161_01525 [Firmicutes bacterium]|nr:hypothetical protein [Bacillota bacterium]
MKEIINYYYNFDIDEIEDNKNYSAFNYYGEDFYFVFFDRDEEELKDIIDLCIELKVKGIRVHDIILNRNKALTTKVGDNFFILLKLNTPKTDTINFISACEFLSKLRLNSKNSKLYRNNWGELWSKKIDYFEYQIREIGKDKTIILDSFSYYIGLAENAISYVNKINKVIGLSEYDNITLSHRRIFYPNTSLNYLNPLSFIFDLEVRDIAEFLKVEFFNGEDSLLDLITFLKMKRLTSYSYHMLYARLLYPSYYFDLYEDIMNNNSNEERLVKIISRVNEYELFLRKAYDEISKYTHLEKIDWLIKKEL